MPQPPTKPIEIVVNGDQRLVPEGLSVLELLRFLEIDPERVAVELNRSIVRQPDWATKQVDSGSQFEIVQFVGGG